MKVAAECVPCLLRRTLYETRLVDPSKERAVMAAALDILARRFGHHPISTDLATEVHLRTYSILGTSDPYAEQKGRANAAARRLLPMARDIIDSADDRLEAAVTVSVVGNVLDFGIAGGLDDPSQFEGRFLALCGEGLGASDMEEIRGMIHRGSRVPFLTDNCGEIVLDALLVEELVRIGCNIDVVVKGGPMLSDATTEDALEARLDRIASRILTTGTAFVGLDPGALPVDTREALMRADLIISKGMGNFEALTEMDLPPVAYLMRTKCAPVSEEAGVPINVNAAFLRR